MIEEFKKISREAEDILYKKGYYVSNMEYDKNCYEVYNGDMRVLIDNLSLSQLEQLSKMLWNDYFKSKPLRRSAVNSLTALMMTGWKLMVKSKNKRRI